MNGMPDSYRLSKQRRNRLANGFSMLEMPCALLIILFFASLPFIGMVAIGIRVACVHLMCYQVTRAAAVAQTYSQGSAVALSTVTSLAGCYPGIDFSGFDPNTDVLVYQTPVNGSAPPKLYNIKNGPPDPNQYVYQYTVTIPTNIAPFMPCFLSFASVPGLNEPLPLNVTKSAYCENPAGLMQ
jgi:hypothetical protein